MVKIKIRENSWIARIAAYRLKCSSVAMVLGKTIHLHNCTKKDFLDNKTWVRHELAHIKQYMELGFLGFLRSYIIESIKKGYQNNRFEVEARLNERDMSILLEVVFV